MCRVCSFFNIECTNTSPTLNTTFPIYPRGQETYGEDPMLTSAMTYALVRGLQEAPLGQPVSRYHRILATSKHWLA